MVTAGRTVVEGVSLQIASGNALGPDAVRAAIGTWFERNLRGAAPAWDLTEWIGPPNGPDTEWVPDPGIAQPALDVEAAA